MKHIDEKLKLLKSFSESNNISLRYRTIPTFSLYLFDNKDGHRIYSMKCDNVDILDINGIMGYIREYRQLSQSVSV